MPFEADRAPPDTHTPPLYYLRLQRDDAHFHFAAVTSILAAYAASTHFLC